MKSFISPFTCNKTSITKAHMKRIFFIFSSIIVILFTGTFAFILWQSQMKPEGRAEYVALGSSFSAGIGLGPLAPHSPIICMRSLNGYPHLLAKMTGLSLVDMSCSGSTTAHIMYGGQFFLGPQINSIDSNTKLVTITSGGNDVGYISDLTRAAAVFGRWTSWVIDQPLPSPERDYAGVTANLRNIVQQVHARAPSAIVAIVSYPSVAPPTGTCSSLGFGEEVAERARDVSTRLREATRIAAEATGVVFVDLAAASVGHDVCSDNPWVYGAAPEHGMAFHPNQEGAAAAAKEIKAAIAIVAGQP